MKATVLQETLSKTLSIVNRFTSVKAQLPVLSNILIKTKAGKLSFSATNLETSIHTSVGAKVEKDGEITVPSRIITDVLSNLPKGQITIETEGEKILLKATNFDSTILGMNSSDFPAIPEKIAQKRISLKKDDLEGILNKVIFSISGDETRPVLTGVLLIINKEEITFVSTDGFRLSQKKVIGGGYDGDEIRIIIPKNSISELLRIMEDENEVLFSFIKEENQVIFQIGDIILSSRIIQGDFPDFERIIPKTSNVKVSLDKEEFQKAIKLASVFARESSNVVKLDVLEKTLNILSESSQAGSQKTEIDAVIEKEIKEFTIAYNYKFIEEFLGASGGEDVKMEFSDTNAPGVFIDPSDTNYLHIIMPVRVQ
jgi:DNA polymerase-3 subunit beta